MALVDKTQLAQPTPSSPELPSTYPAVPQKLAKAFPDFAEFHSSSERLYRRIKEAITSASVDLALPVAKLQQDTKTTEARVVALDTVVTDQGTAIATITEDYATKVYADGAASAAYTQAVSVSNGYAAGLVSTEASVRATKDGYVEGSYTITATAGDVVTGMRLVSANGTTPVSSVVFQANKFQIYNGTSGVPAFDLNGSTLRLTTDVVIQKVAPTATVSPGGAGLFLGADYLGYYNGSAWKTFMDNAGRFYLSGSGSNALSWDGSALTVTGTVNATAGYFGTSSNSVSVSAAGLDVGSSGRILGGATGYNSGTGFWLGNSSGYKLFVGNSAGDKILWDGSALTVTGTINATAGTFSGTVDIGSGQSRTRINTGGIYQGDYFSVTSTLNTTELYLGWVYPVKMVSSIYGSYVRIGAEDSNNRITVSEYSITFGPDTNLYRNAANELKTDDKLVVGDWLDVVNDIATGGRLKKRSSDGWSPPMFDGDNTVEFRWDSSTLQVRIDGTTVLNVTTTTP